MSADDARLRKHAEHLTDLIESCVIEHGRFQRALPTIADIIETALHVELADMERQRDQCEADKLALASALARKGWQPIETAPHETEALWWIVSKTADEAYTDTSGRPIVATFQPYMHRGKYKTWSASSKAVLWHPLPAPPDSEQTPVEDWELLMRLKQQAGVTPVS